MPAIPEYALEILVKKGLKINIFAKSLAGYSIMRIGD